MFNWKNAYFSFLNMDKRPDRLEHMTKELARVGIEAIRHKGELPTVYDLADLKYKPMVARNKTRGNVACYEGQMQIMANAHFHGKTAFVMEDDLIFCDDFKERMDYMENWLNANDPEWDVIWGGGTYHKEPTWHRSNNGAHTHSDLQMCNCTLNKDWEPTNNRRIVRTYGAFSTHAYFVNYKSIAKILKLLQETMPISYGIDWSFILLQPQLRCYAFVPGMVKQMDGQSNIGEGQTIFSNFKHLGKHWFQPRMNNYVP